MGKEIKKAIKLAIKEERKKVKKKTAKQEWESRLGEALEADKAQSKNPYNFPKLLKLIELYAKEREIKMLTPNLWPEIDYEYLEMFAEDTTSKQLKSFIICDNKGKMEKLLEKSGLYVLGSFFEELEYGFLKAVFTKQG
jgi:hypothetical protein